MPQSKYIHLRAIHEDFPDGVKRVRVSVRNDVIGTYETFDVTRCGDLTKAKLEAIIREHFGDRVSEVKFPIWLK